MRQEQLYQGQVINNEPQGYNGNPMLAVGSPKNINMQKGYQVQPQVLNAVFTNNASQLNPQTNYIKPLSTPIYASTQSPKNLNPVGSNFSVPSTPTVGAISTSLNIAGQNNLAQNMIDSNRSNPPAFGARPVPTRPNYHFFGDQSRQNAARSMSPPEQQTYQYVQNRNNSPPVQVRQDSQQVVSRNIISSTQLQNQNPNINSQSRSLSPHSVYSNSSQKNKLIHRVRFFYSNSANTGISQTHVIRHQQIPQTQTHPQQVIQVVQPQPLQPGQPLQPLQQGLQYTNVPMMNNQIVHMENNTIVTSTTIIWEHRFVEIYSKFQIFVEKFETVIEEIYNIDDLFDNVNDEEAWNDLRVRYTDMIQNFNIMREEIIMVLEQNKAAINSLSPQVVREISEKQNAQLQQHEGQQPQHQHGQYDEEHEGQPEEGGETGKSGSENNNHVWENRCLELMQQHQMLTKENNELKEQIQRMKFHEQETQAQAQTQSKQKKHREGENEGTKVAEMQKNLNLIHEEYERLQDNYNRLSIQYSRVISELQNRNPSDMEGVHQELSEMEQQLEMAQAKINQLYGQLQMKDENIKQYQKQIQSYEQILEQNKSLVDTMNKMHHDLDAYENEFKNKQKEINEYQEQINKLHEQLMISNQNLSQHEQHSTNTVRLEDFNKKVKQIQALREEKKNFLNLIEKHEQSIQQMVVKNQRLGAEYESCVKQKEGQINLLERFLQEEREAKRAALSQNYQTQDKSLIENIAETPIFKERLQIEVEQITSQKNRKIRSITQDLEDLKIQVESLQKEKQRQIKQIKQYFVEEEEKYLKRITEKEATIKILQEKTKSFESELSNRNLEISRFRHQSPINVFGSGNQQIKKHNQIIEKKNHQIQLLRRAIEQKNINIKELQQRGASMQQQINGKLFEINSLKRQVNDQNGHRAEIDNLNNIIKKKNQELNEMRLSGVELEQLRINVDSLERQKIRLNQYLKQKTRQCESKDNSIQSLQRKLNSISISMDGYGISRKLSADGPSSSALVNYENLLKQKENEIKNLNYEVEMLQTKVSINQKTIRDLNAKVNNYQKSTSVLKADMQNKLLRYETDIKGLNKQVKSLKDQKEQFRNLVESLQSKNSSLQKSLDERNIVYDKEITRSKQKTVAVQQLNTVLLVDQELHKNQIDRLVKQNKDLNEKIRSLENKIESKNIAMNEMKGNYSKKQKEDMKFYEEKVKKLDSELKISTLRLKNMEQQITNLNRKIELTESQKRSYRSRLINEQSQQKTSYFQFQHAMNSHFESANNQQILEMDRFKLKDPEANDIFQRKVIYELKRENDILRKELSSVGPSSYSVNKYDNQGHHLSYQQQFFTDRDQETKQNQHNNEIISFYKNKNKEQESRIDELIKVNTDLKAKLASSAVTGNQFSVQFYKDQVTKLEAELAEMQVKMKKIMNDHRSVMDESSGHQIEAQSLQDKVNQQNLTITELKKTINKLEITITQIENSKQISEAEIQRLNDIIKKSKLDKEELSKRDITISQMTKKQKSLEEQISKLTNKINIQNAEIERLTEINKSIKNDIDSRYTQNNEETKKLKKRILELERQINLLKEQSQKDNETSSSNAYKLQKIRSFFTEIDALVEEIPTNDRRTEQVVKQVKSGVNEGLSIISLISI